jgi:PilZ domain
MTSEAERRRDSRMEMTLPVRVHGFLSDGTEWEEMSTTEDISSGGACFTLKRSMSLGQVVRLVLPLPKRLRQFDRQEPSYRVYALVRGVTHGDGTSRVGVMFFGKSPPRGFEKNPGARYLMPGDVGSPEPGPVVPPPRGRRTTAAEEPEADPDPDGRRKSARFDLFVNFTLQEFDEWGVVLREELTVAENLGRGGARVLSSLGFQTGDVLFLQEAGGSFQSRVEVRNSYAGPDGIRRLNLKFLDGRTPEHLVRRT